VNCEARILRRKVICHDPLSPNMNVVTMNNIAKYPKSIKALSTCNVIQLNYENIKIWNHKERCASLSDLQQSKTSKISSDESEFELGYHSSLKQSRPTHCPAIYPTNH
jgi:hypothetical protein